MPPSLVLTGSAEAPSAGAPAGANRRTVTVCLWGLGLAYAFTGAGLVYALDAAGGPARQLMLPTAGALALLLALTIVAVRGLTQAHRAARHETEIMGEAFEALPQAALIVDANGRPVRVNAAFEDMFEADGRDPLAVLEDRLAGAPAGAQELKRLSANAAAGRPARAEIDVPGPGGGEWFAVAASPIASRPGYVLWRVEDVTARRQLEQVIRDEHDTLFDFLENAPVGFYSVDEEGRFLFVNNTLAEWLGCSAEEILGGRLRIQDFVAGPCAAGSATGASFSRHGGLEGGEVTLRGRQGRILHAFISQTVVKGTNGDGTRTRSVVRDLTSEHEWEQALLQSERRFEHFFEDAPVGIALMDPDGRITECNRALRELVAANGAGVIGQPLIELIADEDRALIEDRLNRIAGGGPIGAPLQIRLHNDPERVASLFVNRIEEPGGGLSGLILHFLDTTELKKLEVQFAQSQKMQAVGQLAGGIAHDFNNLLTAMIGFCDLLLLRHRPGEESFADIMQIKQNANRAANLVRQLLAFSRQQTVKPKVLSVTDVLAELSNLLRRLIGEKIELKVIHGRDLGLVRVDQGQLEQVIVNLAVNARDAMPDGGALTIRTSNVTNRAPIRRGLEEMPAGDYTLIEIGDSGVGIPKDQIDRIFEPFFSTKEMGAGTGLGLSTVHGIVKQAEGFIFVDSVVGQGTKFSIFLPRYQMPSEVGEAAGELAEAPTMGDLTGAGTVLLAEDEDAVRLFSARALRNKGYKVLEARGGQTAIELIRATREPLDLLVTDVVMPDMDGPALVEWVREHRPGLKIICISGYAEETLRRQLDTTADVHFLAKPFSLEQLAGKVKEVLRQPPAARPAPPASSGGPGSAAPGSTAPGSTAPGSTARPS